MWFKVDDGLHAHRKVRKVRRSSADKVRDVAPFGIWALAGSWCGNNKATAGFIPLEVLEEWDDDAEKLALRLVEAGLWDAETVGDEDGYRFHDWGDYAPRPDGVEDPSDSGRRGNHVRWHENEGIVKEGCEFCETSGATRPDDAPDVGGDITPESQSRPGPSRPDPNPTKASRAARTSSQIDADPDFRAFWAAYPRRDDKGHARTAWEKAIKGTTNPKAIIAAASSFAPDPKFCPLASTWLNGERWNDEGAVARGTSEPHRLPHASEIELAPGGMTDEESSEWMRQQREKRRGA